MDFITNISKAFDHGGFVMWIIFVGQIVSLAIIAERFNALYLRRGLKNKKLAKAFETDIKKGNMTTVLNKAKSLGESQALGRVVEAGVQAAIDMGGKEEIQS